MGNEFSEKHSLDLGIPQGTSLSTTLFIIAMNTAVEKIPQKCQISLFVDDFRFSLVRKSLDKDTQKEIQDILYILETWEDETGFKFAKGKSEILICTRKIHNGELPVLNVKLNNEILKVVEKKLFLGIWYDWRMTWGPHLQYLKDEGI